MEKKLFDEVLDHGLIIDFKLKATRDFQHTLFLIAGIIIGILTCGWTLKKAFAPPYVDLSLLSFSLLIAIFTIKYFISLINFKRLSFTSTKVIIYSNFFGKKYERNIVGFGYRKGTYTEKEKEEDKIAILFSKGRYELICSNSIFNFYQIKQFLEKNYPNIGDKAFKGKDKLNFQKYLAGFLIVSLIILGNFLSTGLEKDNFEKNIKSFNIILKSSPNENDESYYIRSQEYPNFIFNIDGASFQACNNRLEKNFTRGDTFNIGIKNSIYDAKILKNIEPNFWTKHFNWENISIYDLNVNGKNIIDKKDVQKALEDKTNYFSLFLGIVLFILFLFGFLHYYTLSDYE